MQRQGDAFVVEVNDQVTRATAIVPAFGFTADFINAGRIGSDTISSGDTLGLTIWENVDDGLLSVAGAGATVLNEVQVDGAGVYICALCGADQGLGQHTRGDPAG